MEDSTADGVQAPLPGRCAFYVAKKKRYCKMVVGNGKTFCGEHATADKESERKRIPCPLDPKHTVFEDNLAKHMKKCNSKEKPKPVYFVRDINAGALNAEESLIEEVPIADRTKEEMNVLIQRLKNALQGLKTKHVENKLSHPSLNEALSDPKNGEFAFKHLKQQASILGNMEALKLLGPDRCFIEFGAGKGKLSHWIHVALQAAKNVHFLLVERSSTRFKVDGKHKNTDSTFDRLQVDIQHLDLKRVPFLKEKGLPVVGVGKHLCGAATDLALRCLLLHSSRNQRDQPPSKRMRLEQEHEGTGEEEEKAQSPPARENDTDQELQVSGISIALCCHHRCEWRHYVGKDFFRQRGLGQAEFVAFQRMSSWATCGMTKVGSDSATSPQDTKDEPDEEEEHEGRAEAIPDSLNGLVSAEEREHIGRLCKLLINQGRVHYLQKKGFDSSLCYYTSRDVSLENVLLTAVPRSCQP
ncbi:tRNA:m(4)X modification enzyme TRM13 homolog [Chanos chanos]|uniref:tRNA:m(4)X modification enzyme TRM13 n=1 Tax=Chanos chanos TaxID=29144 RepID=A0A6J2WS01_CHACN|nr:tRNA:m(4)X modification enzyme TRM13 homolog [Chanos chanos]